MNPKEQLTAVQKTMREIVEGAKAAARDLTDAEMAMIEAKHDEAIALKGTIERSEKSAALMARLGGMKHQREDARTGEPIVDGRDGWGTKATDALATLASRTPGGAKALVSGTVGVPALLSPTLIESKPRTLLDLIRVVDTDQPGSGINPDDDEVGLVGRATTSRVGNAFSYLRQITRNNNARAVPDGVSKPRSDYGFDQVEDKFRFYVNMTEDLHWRYLEDFRDLVDIVSVQLRDDTLEAIERDVLSGDGEEDRFTGILQTSGVQVQEYTGDLVSTLSAAKYALLGADRNLTGWALNPLDLQAIELLRENGATGAFLFKSRAEIEAFLGAPVVTSGGLAPGQAVAADWTQAELLPVGDDELVFDGKNRTENNTFRIMFEGRYGFRVKKPFDFVSVTLTA
ncbi:phage major capsid protein [Microbacterium testaceum]|uniref:phage major capsid protein n=1 Tax=Microbacterium testaceum TaxID=2033 RepID=UPI00128F7B1B|nr:phage major capsid protein [Microbacterium testaceum]